MKIVKLILILVLIASCRNNVESKPQNLIPQEKNILEVDDQTNFHQDTTYKCKFRKGKSGDYLYKYNVLGVDNTKNKVFGTISVGDKFGEGIIINKDKEEIKINVEWTGHGKLIGIDKKGNEYELEVK